MTTALSMHALHKRFRFGLRGCAGTVDVLRGVTLHVNLGEIVGITGAEGSGKSTLLMCAAGMLRPDAGTLTWFGERATTSVPPLGVAYVPERPCYYPFLTVAEALEYYATARELGRRDRDARVRAALESAGLATALRVRISQLSRCMVQRLGLAQALIEPPRLLLLDDAFSDVEAHVMPRMLTMLRTLAARGVGIVVAGRNLDRLRPVVTRTVGLSLGMLRAVVDQPTPIVASVVPVPARVAEHIAPVERLTM